MEVFKIVASSRRISSLPFRCFFSSLYSYLPFDIGWNVGVVLYRALEVNDLASVTLKYKPFTLVRWMFMLNIGRR